MTEQKEYYSITNKIFNMTDADEWDYTVLAGLASFNLPFVSDKENKASKIETGYITVDMLAQKLVVEDKNNRNKTRIVKSLKKLNKAGVTSIVDTKKVNNTDYFKLAQNIDKEGQNQGFHSMIVSEFEKICFEIEKVGDKTKAFGCYMFICHRVFKPSKIKNQANFNWVNQLQAYICWDTQDNIGKAYNKKRESVSKTIKQLVDTKVIVVKKIRRKGEDKEVKSIYSKYSDKEKMEDYIKLQIENGEYKKEVVKVVKADKVKTTKATAKVDETKTKTKTKTKVEKVAKTKVAKADETNANKKELLNNLMLKNDTQKIENDDYRKAIELAVKNLNGEKEQELIRLASFRAKENDTKSNIDDLSKNMNDLFSFN